MSFSCHRATRRGRFRWRRRRCGPPSGRYAVDEIKEIADVTFALAGNPNTGKSTLFNQLTGLNVETANYPGKTVELNLGTTNLDGTTIAIIDLPGTYALGAVSEDQWVARRGLLDGRPDVVVVVVDASNLKRNLYLVFQFIELGFPVVVALNLVDYAAKLGIKIDHERLSEILGVPVVPTVATRGLGVRQVVEEVVKVAKEGYKIERPRLLYDDQLEKAISSLTEEIAVSIPETPFGIPPKALAVQLIEGDSEFKETVQKLERGQRVLRSAAEVAELVKSEWRESPEALMSRERYELAARISRDVEIKIEESPPLSERLKLVTVSPRSGLPIMVTVMAAVFAAIYWLGGLLSEALDSLWGGAVSPIIGAGVYSLFGEGLVSRVILWGADAGVLASLSVGVPFVLTFYLVLSVLEDSGYLNSLAFLSDSIMHRLGLHGRAIIPMITGAGCNVPAIMSTRVLETKRERLLACALIVLVPCSARVAVILGAVANLAGWSYALSIFLIELGLIGAVGMSLNRILPGESRGLVMEMFPIRAPSPKIILKKTWYRFKGFLLIAFPMVIAGSLVMGILFETGALWRLASPLEPGIYWLLGLPAVAGVALIFGILRKELTLELLIALAIVQYGPTAQSLLTFLSPLQLFIFALVVTIYIPCVATISVLGREVGWRRTLLISMFTIGLAVTVGALSYRVVQMIHGVWTLG